MKLHYKTIGSNQATLVIVHGLFGSLDNWQTHAKKLADYFRVISVDMRNHGHSPWHEHFSVQVMVDDLKELFDDLQLKHAILLGHSMGGKIAMTFAQQYPDLLSKLVIVDIGIKKYPPHHQQIISTIQSLDLNAIQTRAKAADHMAKYIQSAETRQFLLKNLYWKEQKLTWRMNIKAIIPNINTVLEPIAKQECMIPTLFIRGEESNYIVDEDMAEIETIFIDSEFVTIHRAGHWVHAEQPDEFLHTLLAFALR